MEIINLKMWADSSGSSDRPRDSLVRYFVPLPAHLLRNFMQQHGDEDFLLTQNALIGV